MRHTNLITFLAGERLGAVSLLPPVSHGLFRLSISWAVALVVISVVVRGIVPDDDAPRYRGTIKSLRSY